MAEDNQMSQDDIEKLLSQGASTGPAKPAVSPPASGLGMTSPDDSKLLSQDDIEKLLSKSGKGTAAAPPPLAKGPSTAGGNEGSIAEKDIELLLNQAEQALESINAAAKNDLPQGISAFRLEELSGAAASTDAATLDLVRDVELDLKIELGRTHMYLEDVLKLRKGSVVPLDKLAGDPVDIFVNGRLVARGEVLVLNDNFCVRVAELITGVNAF